MSPAGASGSVGLGFGNVDGEEGKDGCTRQECRTSGPSASHSSENFSHISAGMNSPWSSAAGTQRKCSRSTHRRSDWMGRPLRPAPRLFVKDTERLRRPHVARMPQPLACHGSVQRRHQAAATATRGLDAQPLTSHASVQRTNHAAAAATRRLDGAASRSATRLFTEETTRRQRPHTGRHRRPAPTKRNGAPDWVARPLRPRSR